MKTVYGQEHSPDYLNMVQSMSNLLKMNHKYRVSRILLDIDEMYVSFKLEEAI